MNTGCIISKLHFEDPDKNYATCQISTAELRKSGVQTDDCEDVFKLLTETFSQPVTVEGLQYRITTGELNPQDQTISLLFERQQENPNPVQQAMPGLLAETRPMSLNLRASEAFDHAKIARFVWHGSSDYYFSTQNYSAKELISTYLNLSRRGEGIIRKAWRQLFLAKQPICDVGTGNGKFLLELERSVPGTEAFGVSAGQKLDAVDDTHFLVGDLDQFADLASHNRFQILVSSLTFRHLVDPARTLCQTYELLRPGGVLIIDRIHFPGLKQNELEMLHTYLKRAGYPIVAEYRFDTSGEKNGFEFLVIKKTHARLELPLHYQNPLSEEAGKAIYELDIQARDFASPAFKNSALQKIKTAGSKELKEVTFKQLAQTPGKRILAWKAYLSELIPVPWTKQEMTLVANALQAEDLQHIIQARVNDEELKKLGILNPKHA